MNYEWEGLGHERNSLKVGEARLGEDNRESVSASLRAALGRLMDNLKAPWGRH